MSDSSILLQCPFCDKCFDRQCETERHIKVHTKEKPFKCLHPVCDKYFSRKDNMMQHYKCHQSGGYIARREEKVKKYKDLKNQITAANSLKILAELAPESTSFSCASSLSSIVNVVPSSPTSTPSPVPSYVNLSFPKVPNVTLSTSLRSPTFAENKVVLPSVKSLFSTFLSQ